MSYRDEQDAWLNDRDHRQNVFRQILGDEVVDEHQLVFIQDAESKDIRVWTGVYREDIGTLPYYELSYKAMRGTTDLCRYVWEKVGQMLADYTEPILIMRRAQVGG